MRNKYKIAVLGGDLRQYAVEKELNKSGAEVYTYGLSAQVEDESKIKVCEEVFLQVIHHKSRVNINRTLVCACVDSCSCV